MVKKRGVRVKKKTSSKAYVKKKPVRKVVKKPLKKEVKKKKKLVKKVLKKRVKKILKPEAEVKQKTAVSADDSDQMRNEIDAIKKRYETTSEQDLSESTDNTSPLEYEDTKLESKQDLPVQETKNVDVEEDIDVESQESAEVKADVEMDVKKQEEKVLPEERVVPKVLDKHMLKTKVDIVLEIIINKKRISLRKILKHLNEGKVKKSKVKLVKLEEWCKILDAQGLAELVYPKIPFLFPFMKFKEEK